jgi:hypothetical protein
MKHPRRAVGWLVAGLILLQGADFVLTWRLLSRPGVREANPVALAVLDRHGWAGLALLKGACTAVALAAALLLWRRRAVTAVRLLRGCCAVLAGVAVYSLTLLLSPADPQDAALDEIRARRVVLNGQHREVLRFLRERQAVCKDALSGRHTVPQAIERMARCIERARPGMKPRAAERLPPVDQPARVATYLVFHAGLVAQDVPALLERLPELQREVTRRYPQADPAHRGVALRGAPTF